ncbi:hypothetical protein BCM02_11092 [Paenibacillus methanolicus]|uniref:FhuF-like iron-sulfur protein n=2 Tax=Paenibacillus methanolicus TaxID=582686 RepID=A0A5S5BY68_9BACL|nr:hypothetical protein BCM02_11092 [Paenibacillus methanolicus]
MDFSLVRTYFHLSPEGFDHPLLELAAASLTDADAVIASIRAGSALVQATGNELVASFMGTSLCNLCATLLIFGAQYDRLLDLSLTNLTFQAEQHDDHAHLGYRIGEVRWTDIPAEGRAEFLLERWTAYLREEIVPAVEAIATHAGMKSALIWNQYAYQLAYVRDFILEHEPREEVKARFLSDYALLTEGVPAEVFGRKTNPFLHRNPRYVDNPWQPGKPLMMNSSCCLYHCRVDGEKCYTCPKMTPAERDARRERVLAELAGAAAG